jgi:hypothetical protein
VGLEWTPVQYLSNLVTNLRIPHQRREGGISWPALPLSASQEGLFTELAVNSLLVARMRVGSFCCSKAATFGWVCIFTGVCKVRCVLFQRCCVFV